MIRVETGNPHAEEYRIMWEWINGGGLALTKDILDLTECPMRL